MSQLSRPLTAVFALSLAAGILASGGCRNPFYIEAKSDAIGPYEAMARQGTPIGQARFLFDDFSGLSSETLNTNALPWKLVATALLMKEAPRLGLPVEQSSINTIFQHFGFINPEHLANWDTRLGPEPKLTRPVGMVQGTLERKALPKIELQVTNINCAACHTGVTYDEHGMPTKTAWLGTPNTSLDFDHYITSVYQSLKSAMRDEKGLLAEMQRVYPGMSKAEANTYKSMVFPKLRKKLKTLEATTDSFVPFRAGLPGVLNGVAAIKRQLGLFNDGKYHGDENAYVQVPDYGDVAFRSSITWDGVYGVRGEERFHPVTASDATPDKVERLAGIAAYFSMQAFGVSFERAEGTIPRTREVLGWVAGYRPPRFPGPIDRSKALEGSEIFETRCSKCHGTYSAGIDDVRLLSYPNRLVPQDVNNTDPTRWMAVDPNVIDLLNKTSFAKYVDLAQSEGYVAPKLTGVWITAPYLHNGSVPTLWHLMHPSQRPTKFEVGGHKLDFQKMGIAGQLDADGVYRYLPGYQPWSDPQIYDTTLPGQSNAGHDWQFDGLSEDQIQALIEYLKVL